MNENKRQKIDNIIGKLKTLDYQLRNSRFLPDDKPKNVLEGAIAQLDSIEGSIKEVISCELDSHSSVPGNLRPADIPEAMRLAIYHLNNAKMKIKPVKDAIVKATGEFNPLLWQEFDYGMMAIYTEDLTSIIADLEAAKKGY